MSPGQNEYYIVRNLIWELFNAAEYESLISFPK